jgi:hypothetical protein
MRLHQKYFIEELWHHEVLLCEVSVPVLLSPAFHTKTVQVFGAAASSFLSSDQICSKNEITCSLYCEMTFSI